MKKLITALLTCMLTAAMLGGCGKAADDANSSNADVNAEITAADQDAADTDAQADGADDAAAGDEEGASAEVKTVKEGVLTMATNATFPPYEYYESDAIVGIDAEIAEAVAKKLGLELKIEDMEFDSIILAVTQGKADLGLAGMTVTVLVGEVVLMLTYSFLLRFCRSATLLTAFHLRPNVTAGQCAEIVLFEMWTVALLSCSLRPALL